MDRFKNKYRNASIRANWWDYGWNGAYFITICTKNREYFFGEIKNGEMILSQTGIIVDILWHEIPNHASFIELGDFVVMPNHIHGILIVDKPNGDTDRDTETNVGARHALHLQHLPSQQTVQPSEQKSIGKQRFQNIGKNTVSSIIGSYKSAVTKHANRLGTENGWQSRFHDHIIRNDVEYQRISNYIINNPSNWKDDRFNNH